MMYYLEIIRRKLILTHVPFEVKTNGKSAQRFDRTSVIIKLKTDQDKNFA